MRKAPLIVIGVLEFFSIVIGILILIRLGIGSGSRSVSTEFLIVLFGVIIGMAGIAKFWLSRLRHTR